MTKTELKGALKTGKVMEELLPSIPGQECEIYKASSFALGDDIIYIPDIWLNEIPYHTVISDDEVIKEILLSCYSGNDFVEECDGDVQLAERLFRLCDWQHPSSLLPELMDND